MGANASRLSRIRAANRAELLRLEGSLASAARGREIRTLYVTSARPGEGKTTTAASIAYGLSSSHQGEVVLVEANMRAPIFGELYDIPQDAPGLTDYLSGDADLGSVLQLREEAGVPAVIPCGSGSPSGTGTAELREHLGELRERFGYVIFDGDAVFSSSAPAMQAPVFDGVALVVECGETKWEVVNLAHRTLADAGASVLGVVMNKREYPIPAGLYQKV